MVPKAGNWCISHAIPVLPRFMPIFSSQVGYLLANDYYFAFFLVAYALRKLFVLER